MKIDLVKVIGIAGTVLGLGATLMSNYASDKKTEKEIEEKVAEALAKK